MQETAKRLFVLVLALTIVCGLLPVNVLATELSSEPETPVAGTVECVYINPRYSDVITEEDLVKPVDTGVMPLANSEYLTVAEAGVMFREAMKAREESVTLNIQTTESDFETFVASVVDVAEKHTGVPTEGDYLAWQYGGLHNISSYYSSGGTHYHTITFTITYYTSASQEAEMDAAVDNLLSRLNPTGTDYEKLKTVYDWMCRNITYDYDSIGSLKHSAYAALVNRTAVCQGYTNLLYRLVLEMDIDCRIITGIGNNGDHAWNIVRLGGMYYNVDSTWDAIWLQQVGYYEYFLVDEASFTGNGTDHIRDAEYETPAFHSAYPTSTAAYDPSADSGTPSIIGGKCGENLEWRLEDGTLTISGTGAMDDLIGGRPWDDYSSQITKAVVESGVTSIGSSAFAYCSALESVFLHDGLTSIGDYAFYGCSSLAEIALPDSLTELGTHAFCDCTALTDIVVPGSVKTIEPFTFEFCSALASVTIGEGITSIGTAAFENCHALTDVTIPSTVTSIGDSAFYSCRSLARVTIPAGVTSLGSMAFGTYYSDSAAIEITFEGDAPEMIPAEDSWFGTFQDVTATAYYPADNATWTEEVLTADHGGTITWVPYTPDAALRGDLNGDAEVDDSDVAQLLWFTLFPGIYEIQGNADFDGNNTVDDADVAYLLWHTLFPESYPL